MNKLLPCPFCGHKADIFPHSVIPTTWLVICWNSHCGVYFTADTKEAAMTIWNTRVLPFAYKREINKLTKELTLMSKAMLNLKIHSD